MIDKQLLEIFLDLIKIEGVSQQEAGVAEYIKRFLMKYGFKFHEDDSKKSTGSNTGNIIVKIGSGGEIILASHMDTARSTLNVNPQLQNDRITSDGTTVLGVDNRMGIAILLRLLQKVQLESIITKDFSVAFTTCEETTLAGSMNLRLNGTVKYGFVFDSYMPPGKFVANSYGAATFKIEINGKASHSGIAPEQGINALDIAIKAMSGLSVGKVTDTTVINFGKISGGSAVNVIPEKVIVEGEVRSLSIAEGENILEKISQAFRRAAQLQGGKLDFSYKWDFKPYSINKNSFTYNKIYEVLRKINLDPVGIESRGGSDANSLNEKGIESINIGIGAQNPHSNDEFVLYDDFEKSLKIALELVRAE